MPDISRNAGRGNGWPSKVSRGLLLIFLLAALGALQASADISTSGFYEVNYEQLQDNPGDSHGGNLGYIKHYFEMRFLSQPASWVETYFKVGANGEDVLRPDNFHVWENHLQARRWGIEAVLFSNEWRHSFSEYLLGLISGEARGDFGRAQGLRLDYRAPGGSHVETLLSRNGEGDDVYVFRHLNKLSSRLALGATYLHRDWTDANVHPDSSYNRVVAGDVELAFTSARYTLEYAEAANPSLQKRKQKRWVDGRVGNRSAMKFEARGLNFLGINFLGHYRDYGREFHDMLSDQFHPIDGGSSFDQTGMFIQAVAPLPRKAITLTVRHDRHETSYDPEKRTFLEWEDGRRRPYRVRWTQAELYIEFKGGITARTNYEWYLNRNPIRKEFKLSRRTESYFLEVQSENEIALVKFQVKQKDIGQKDRVYGGARRFGERTIFGTEVKANISEKWQIYSRMATVNAQVDTWSTLMAHVGYFISPRAEIFVEFGSGWHTDNDLTNDNDIADNIREIDQKLFFVTKVSF